MPTSGSTFMPGGTVITGGQTINLGAGQAWTVNSSAGVAILTVTDGSPSTVKSGVGLQLYAATASPATSKTLISIDSTPDTILSQDGSGNTTLQSVSGKALKLTTAQGSGINILDSTGIVQYNATIGLYNSITAAGLGVPAIYGAAKQTNETGAAAVLSYMPPATPGTYRISCSIDCISSTAGIGGWTATWDDSGGNEQAPANLELYDTAVLLGAFTFTYTAGHHYYSTPILIDIDNSADSIVILTTKTSGAFSITVSALIEQLQ